MACIKIIGPGGQVQEKQIVSKEAHVLPHNDSLEDFHPDIAESVDYDHKGGTSHIKTVCGESERRRSSDNLADITIEGFVTKSNLPNLKQLSQGDEVLLISDIHQGDTFVKRVSIGQESDRVEYVPQGSDEGELAFDFQLQLGQPEEE